MAYTVTYEELMKKLKKGDPHIKQFFVDVGKLLKDENLFFGDEKGLPQPKKQYVIKVGKENWNAVVGKMNPLTKSADKADWEVSGTKIRLQITGKKTVVMKQDAKSTAQQEDASAYVFTLAQNGKKMPDVDEIQKIYPDVDDVWYQSFAAQREAFLDIKKKFQLNGQYDISRDGKFMSFISTFVRKFGYASKDAWNPADVWMIRNGKEATYIKDIESINHIDQLNAYMKNAMLNGDIVGISLKKTGKSAHYEVSNLEKKAREAFFTVDRIKFDFTLNDKGTFTNAESSYYITGDNFDGKGQARMFPLKPRQNIQFEIAGRLAVVRLGKVPKGGIHNTLGAHGFAPPTWQDVPLTLADFKKTQQHWLKMWRLIASSSYIDTNVNPNDFVDIVSKAFSADSYTVESIVCSKLQNLMYVYYFAELEKHRHDIITDFVYLAKKEDDNAGPFIKIY